MPIWRDELKLTEKEKKSLDSILKKLHFKAPPKKYVTQVRIHGKRQEIMKRAFAKNHIYLNPSFDIFGKIPKYSIS